MRGYMPSVDPSSSGDQTHGLFRSTWNGTVVFDTTLPGKPQTLFCTFPFLGDKQPPLELMVITWVPLPAFPYITAWAASTFLTWVLSEVQTLLKIITETRISFIILAYGITSQPPYFDSNSNHILIILVLYGEAFLGSWSNLK